MPGEFILNGFGLNAVKPLLYVKGQPLEQNASTFPDQALQESSNMTIKEDGTTTLSLLGTPVFADMELVFEDSRIYFNTVLLDVTQTKNIVKTPIQGRNGTVKEYIADGDFIVNIKGAIVDPLPRKYPEDDVRDFIELIKQPFAIEVVSPFLQQFGIYNLVIEDYSIPQTEGMINTQLFELTCLSDAPIELIEYA